MDGPCTSPSTAGAGHGSRSRCPPEAACVGHSHAAAPAAPPGVWVAGQPEDPYGDARGRETELCPAGETCAFECPQGGCAFSCAEGSTCNVECDGGHCKLACGINATCNIECDGGQCGTGCGAGATCNMECDGGQCASACAPDASCNTDCDGGDCS
jgi:hypothetical protein